MGNLSQSEVNKYARHEDLEISEPRSIIIFISVYQWERLGTTRHGYYCCIRFVERTPSPPLTSNKTSAGNDKNKRKFSCFQHRPRTYSDLTFFCCGTWASAWITDVGQGHIVANKIRHTTSSSSSGLERTSPRMICVRLIISEYNFIICVNKNS